MAKKSSQKTPKLGASKAKESKPKEKYLGGKLIIRITPRVINDKEFNSVELEDGTAKLLSDKDLEAQVTSNRGELVH